jgi:hypothetical protein
MSISGTCCSECGAELLGGSPRREALMFIFYFAHVGGASSEIGEAFGCHATRKAWRAPLIEVNVRDRMRMIRIGAQA